MNNMNNWSGICSTSEDRNQCSKENCTQFPICKIRKMTTQKLAKEIRETIDSRKNKADIGTLVRIYRFCGKVLEEKK